jgi:hypothetical protein
LQEEENDQCDDKQNTDLRARAAKRRGQPAARAVIVPIVIAAATAFPVSSVHDGLFER